MLIINNFQLSPLNLPIIYDEFIPHHNSRIMQIIIDVITIKQEIYHALLESEDNQSIIGISSRDLGPGMFMTSVKEIVDEGDEVLIVLNSFDVTGYFLEKNKISLSNISSVLPFKAVFSNPFLKEIEEKEKKDKDQQKKKLDYIF